MQIQPSVARRPSSASWTVSSGSYAPACLPFSSSKLFRSTRHPPLLRLRSVVVFSFLIPIIPLVFTAL
uniref:FGENESH: predicted gene_21.7 protein n=1 Tax=Rhodotorula toruloides TaxID=5286 RepID=A0A0K3CWC1_RHOTO